MSDQGDQPQRGKLTRRGLLKGAAAGGALAALGSTAALLGGAMGNRRRLWQIDPDLCTQCGRCATHCVVSPSAVKCVHSYGICGYCDRCFGYFEPTAMEFNEAAENQMCPTGAISRHLVSPPYYEYSVDEPLCIGCGKCVKGCRLFGNGSMQLQVRHDRCLNCNQCAIAAACPAGAFVRVDASRPYLLRKREGNG